MSGLPGFTNSSAQRAKKFSNPDGVRDHHARRLIANILECVKNSARHEHGIARTTFMPLSLYQKRDSALEHMKCFVFVRVIMRRGPATRRSDIRPHCEFSVRAFAIEMNDYFFAERSQHAVFALAG